MTAYDMRISDWSADVCSSDLVPKPEPAADLTPQNPAPPATAPVADTKTAEAPAAAASPTQSAARALPSFARRRAALGASGLHWKSAAAIAALALLLALQLLLADRDRLDRKSTRLNSSH